MRPPFQSRARSAILPSATARSRAEPLRSAKRRSSSTTTSTSTNTRSTSRSRCGTSSSRWTVQTRRPTRLPRQRRRDILKQIKAGGNFAELAKKNSDDPGSKDQGGELGFLKRGATVPEFDQAAFTLAAGTDLRPGEDQVRLSHPSSGREADRAHPVRWMK